MELTLKKGNYTAVIETLGGELISYRDGAGLEYIWQGDEASWTGRNPILFPIVGKLKDGMVMAGDKECRMPQHGLARKREFAVVDHGEDYAVLEQREGPDTLASYPFPYLLRVRQDIREKSFTTTITVENPGAEPLPFCVGAHTGFRCPLLPGERFEEYGLVFDEKETKDAGLPTADGLLDREKTMPALKDGVIALDYAVFDAVDTLVFDGLRSKGVSLKHRESGRGVHVDFTSFPMVAFWTPPGKSAPFLCIEPWQGGAAYVDEAGQFEDKPYAVTLQPGRTWSIGYTVTVF